jgi:hypothetical protein
MQGVHVDLLIRYHGSSCQCYLASRGVTGIGTIEWRLGTFCFLALEIFDKGLCAGQAQGEGGAWGVLLYSGRMGT